MRKKKKKLQQAMSSEYDLLGSYTGCYLIGEYEEPIQDVDDL